MNKGELRKIIYGSMRDLTIPYKTTADETIRAKICELKEYKDAQTVFCFVGIQDEVNTSPLLEKMLEDGKTVCVPLCKSPGVMEARQITSMDDLSEGKYGIPEPAKDAPRIDPSSIDFSVIPCVTCNKRGQRLGHGGGYYDRFFENLDKNAVIVCREETMTAAIPTDSHDIIFPVVVSERNIYRNK